jgi:type II secretory pathway pseudopilin PulG
MVNNRSTLAGPSLPPGDGWAGSVAAPGYCLIELVAAVGIAATVSAAAVPQLLVTVDDSRALAAARYITSRLQETRMEAVTRTINVAMRIVQNGASYDYAVYADGNGNGVLSRDIQRGIDPAVHAAERLPERFTDTDFGVLPGVPAVDPASAAPGTDPIKLGSSNMVSFTAVGTSSTGTLYIRGKRSSQYAVIVFGETGKTRIMKYIAATRQWRAL